MVLPDVVKQHPVISAVVFLSAVALVGFTAATFFQGTGFVDDQGCAWSPLEKPDGGNFTSVDEVENFFEENDRELPDDLRLDERDGVVYHNVPGECGTVGGEAG